MPFQVWKYTGVFKKRMLEEINANNVTLYGIVLLRVILVMNIFQHLAPLKVVVRILWNDSECIF